MLRRLVGSLASWIRGSRVDDVGDAGNDESGDEETGDSENGFLPSRLDASVLYAHGLANSGADREIANVRETARVLEDERRDN